MPVASTPMIFETLPPLSARAPATMEYDSRVPLPEGVLLGRKYSARTHTSACSAYSCFTSSLFTISTAMFSRPVTGEATLPSATSRMTSTFLERCDPFCTAGRSTKMSMLQLTTLLSGLVSPSLLISTGLRTPVTPTLVSLKPDTPLLYCMSHSNNIQGA